MPSRLMTQQLSAELATVDQILRAMPADDVLGRLSLQSRRDEIAGELHDMDEKPSNVASIALIFGGRPVFESRGIDAGFASDVLSRFQELVKESGGASKKEKSDVPMPMVPHEESSFHITALLPGSVGFLLEDIEAEGRLFESSLKKSADRATEVLAALADEDDLRFATMLENVDQHVLGTARDFFKQLYHNGATLRVVEGMRDLTLTTDVIARAFSRAENASIQEVEEHIEGVLLGLIPIGRKFEIRKDDGTVISGSVAATLSEAYLERLRDEELVGKRCVGQARIKRISRFGRVIDTVVLLDLIGIGQQVEH